MTYKLMRCYFKHRGSTFDTLVFDLWNNEFNTGYEINVTLYKMGILITELDKYVKDLINQTCDISKWDLIIRNIKQKKLYSWRGGKMIKYFCDRCNTPMTEIEYNAAPIMPVYRKVVPQFGEVQYLAQEHITICNKCVDKYNEFIKGDNK